MAYRDVDADNARRVEIARELVELRSRVVDYEYLKWRQVELETELVRLHETRLPLLANAKDARRCSVAWNDMEGNDCVRHCARCNRSVYKISAMTAAGADQFLREEADAKQFFRRADDTFVAANCRPRFRAARIVGGAVLIMLALATTAVLMIRTLGPSISSGGTQATSGNFQPD